MRFLRRVFTLAAGEGLARVLGVVTSVIIARSLGVAGFGSFSAIFAVALILLVFVDLGQNAHLTRMGSRDSRVCGGLLRDVTANKIVSTVVVAALAGVIGALIGLGNDEVTALVLMVVWTGGFTVFESVRSIARARDQFAADSVANTLESVMRLVCVVTAAVLKGGLVGFALAHAVEAVLSAAAYYYWLGKGRRLACGPYRPSDSRAILRASLPIGLTMIAMAGFYRLDQVLVHALAGAVEAGYYAAASRITLSANAIGILVGMVSLPTLSRTVAGTPEAVRELRRALGIAVVLGGVGAALVAVFASPIVLLMFGQEYASAIPMLRALAPVVLFSAITVVATSAASAFHQEHRVVLRAYILVALNLAGNLILVPRFGGLGSAVVSTVGEICMAGSILLVMRKSLVVPRAALQSE